MYIGYVRVSKHEQNENLQIDALQAAGCEKWFVDKINGKKFERKGLDEALAYVRPGDTLVVWKLDRAGRSLKHLIDLLNSLQERGIDFVSLTEKIDTTSAGGKLIFHIMGALAEFEHALIRERTYAGLESARARGRMGGRPRALKSQGRITTVLALYREGKLPIDEICEEFSISRTTLFRYAREARKKEQGAEEK